MSTADRILNHLARIADPAHSHREGPYYQSDGAPPTAREIADAIGANPSTVTATLRRLAADGKVRQAGEAYSGGRTWTLVKPNGEE